MHPHVQPNSGAGQLPADRAGETALSSGGSDRRRQLGRRLRLRPTALKPLTYSMMHLTVAIGVAFALTRDWRIALGVGVASSNEVTRNW